MINRDGYLPRVFCLALLITCHFTNSVSNNVSTKCHRRGYHALLFNPTAWSKPMCDVWQRHDVVNKVNGETIEFKPDMRLPRIDPVEVCMIVWYLLMHNEFSTKCVETHRKN